MNVSPATSSTHATITSDACLAGESLVTPNPMISFRSDDNEWVLLLTSGGLFLGTALLFLWTTHRTLPPSNPSIRSVTTSNTTKNDVVKLENDGDDTKDVNFHMEWYRLRRMEDRMSFRESDNGQRSHLPYPQPTRIETSSGLPNAAICSATDNNAFDHTRRRRSSESVVQSNWNHFEGYHSDDDRQPTIETTHQQEQQQRKNVQHVNEIHPMIKSSNIFRDVNIDSDSGEETLSKLLEGEDLPDQELFCGYASLDRNSSKQHKFTSPSITPPPFRSSSSSTYDEPMHHPSETFENGAVSRPVPRLPDTTSFLPPTHIRRTRSVPDPTLDVDGTLDSQTATNQYIASNRMARAKYNASIMPNKLILIRHGQSLGNVDEKLYATTPDNAMPLTELGWEQARAAGKQLKHLLTSSSSSTNSSMDTTHFIVSPYVRTVETFHGIVSAWCDPSEFDHIEHYEQRLNAWYSRLMDCGLTWAEDPRIREQDFGNYQEPKMIQQAKRDRHMFGAFYYRFPLGESASDVRLFYQPKQSRNNVFYLFVCISHNRSHLLLCTKTLLE